MSDLRHALRLIFKSPGFAFSVIGLLAFGMAQNTAMFSGANPILFRPLAVDDPERLVVIEEVQSQTQQVSAGVSWPLFQDWQSQASSFSGIGLYERVSLILGTPVEQQWVSTARVTPSLINLLGVRPVLGRLINHQEDKPGAAPVALISHGLWQRMFDGDPRALGATIQLNDTTHTVIGIMPADFSLPDEVEVWIPLIPSPAELERGAQKFSAMARLTSGATISQASTELNGLCTRLASAHPEEAGMGVRLTGLHAKLVEDLSALCWVNLIAGGFVLLVVCANVGNLLLARAVERQREFAIRAALGASRVALLRQLLLEGAVLSLLAGALGLLLSHVLLDLVVSWVPAPPRWINFALDGRVLAYTAAAMMLACLAFSVAPMLEALRTDVQRGLRSGGTGVGTSAERHRLRDLLLVSQVALTLLLLYGSGLLIRTVVNLQNAEMGFDPHNVLTFRIRLPDSRYATAEVRQRFHQNLLASLHEQPGFESAAAVSHLPLTFHLKQPYQLPDRPASDRTQPTARTRFVSHGYFSAMKIRLVAGRDFTPTDDALHPRVAIIDEGFARKEFSGENALGRRINIGGQNAEIVGIVAQVPYEAIDGKTRGGFYLPYAQARVSSMYYVVRTTSDQPSANLLPTLRAALAKLDPSVPIHSTRTMSDIVATSFWPKRVFGRVLMMSGVISLILASIGVAASAAYGVARRTREIGLRRALGAADGDVFKGVVKQQLGVILIGIALGAAGCIGIGPLLADQLYQVPLFDPVTLASGAAALVVVALGACVLPARRAILVDPNEALRAE